VNDEMEYVWKEAIMA